MRLTAASGRLVAGLLLSGFILAAAGCQSRDRANAKLAEANPAEPKVAASELLAYCPKVVLRDGTAFFNTYAKGGDGDPAKLLYQASIADVSRSCTHAGGTLTMNVAVAGKIVPGPADSLGTITMPIRIAAMRGEEVLYSQLHQYKVSVGDASAATQFVFSDPNVNMPNPEQADITVYAGFDEGFAKPKKPAAE